MTDLESIHDEMRRVREETDADREVREQLRSAEEALSAMHSDQNDMRPDRLKEIRAELERIGEDATGETSEGLTRLRTQLREYERDVK
ncbi:DUF7553 family protein [Halorussus ruber]|uniref:DUF7553 family protein n=1 Tax=Halorussus ruber TaxID=1126238 RepID=UPI001091F5D5|nr:hypothetical protein [Halorussus ruber]